ncbi:hypothetical protein CPT_Mater96 [Bacillus phage Mater]|uniref:Uncharacterized protein n=1 Tax=Bacillus phage Mater TaxID=1540090 RepID=A0A0A0RUL1_9CAUD|nr:hypothetical protein CPT_Mater96 [Bacillus phage Mater]AIW03253.1 hypothetical protein CPT_Mater96 [Bacillus phage Mater]
MSVYEKIGFAIVMFIMIVVGTAVLLGIIVGATALLTALGLTKLVACIAALALVLFIFILIAVFFGN